MNAKLTFGPGVPLLAGVVALGAMLPATSVADDVFLRLGDVRGESIDARHKDEIDVYSYTQAFSGAYARDATGRTSGKPTCGAVTIVKAVDRASPTLVKMVTTGQHIPHAVFTFRSSGGSPVEYYRVTLDDVVLSELEQVDNKVPGANGTTIRVMEKVSMIARRFLFEYTYVPSPGGAGQPLRQGYDCVQNRPF